MRDPTGLFLLVEHGQNLYYSATWASPQGEAIGPADEEQAMALMRADRLELLGDPSEVLGFHSHYAAKVFRVKPEADEPFIVEG